MLYKAETWTVWKPDKWKERFHSGDGGGMFSFSGTGWFVVVCSVNSLSVYNIPRLMIYLFILDNLRWFAFHCWESGEPGFVQKSSRITFAFNFREVRTIDTLHRAVSTQWLWSTEQQSFPLPYCIHKVLLLRHIYDTILCVPGENSSPFLSPASNNQINNLSDAVAAATYTTHTTLCLSLQASCIYWMGQGPEC